MHYLPATRCVESLKLIALEMIQAQSSSEGAQKKLLREQMHSNVQVRRQLEIARQNTQQSKS